MDDHCAFFSTFLVEHFINKLPGVREGGERRVLGDITGKGSPVMLEGKTSTFCAAQRLVFGAELYFIPKFSC